MLLAVAAEPNRGWGGPLALLAAFVIFRVVVMPAGRWVMTKIGNPSPPPELPAGSRLKAQATVGSDRDEPDQVHEWGRVSYDKPTGRELLRLRMAQARQVWRTGSHELPPTDDDLYTESDRDPDIDLPLADDEQDDGPDGDEGDQGETAEEYIARARGLQVPYSQIVKVVMEYYDLPESTVKHRIRKVDTERRG